MGGSAVIGFVSLYEILDDPLPECARATEIHRIEMSYGYVEDTRGIKTMIKATTGGGFCEAYLHQFYEPERPM